MMKRVREKELTLNQEGTALILLVFCTSHYNGYTWKDAVLEMLNRRYQVKVTVRKKLQVTKKTREKSAMFDEV